jgi:protein phosphatase
MQENERQSGVTIQIPDFAVVVLIGVSGSGKSTFARKHFLPSECLSSDAFRYMVSDDENDQSATNDAFEALHSLAEVRLRRRKIVVIDATNVQEAARMPLVELAQRNDVLAVAIVLNVSERTCQDRNRDRPDRQFGPHVVGNQSRQLRQSLPHLRREGFRYIFKFNEAEIADVAIERIPLWTDRRREVGPFDIVGDIHGCGEELAALLTRLGYAEHQDAWRHPEGRRAVFVGDLVDRGPKIVETVRLVRKMMQAGTALCVPGNHDTKLSRALKGNPVAKTHGLAQSLEQIEALPEEERAAFIQDYLRFAEELVSHLWLDGGALCVAHAGMKESYIGRASGRVRDFALYGETTGETDEFGLPIRYPWAQDYRGKPAVIYGHTPVPEAEWLNNTLNLDTGCVFGGKLTALRWPERELVEVVAQETYAEPVRPFLPAAPDPNETTDVSLQWQHDELLRAEDVLGKRIVTTRLIQSVIVPAENAAAALEVMSRFAVEPRWLLYLPPTMSPCETAPPGDLLERPEEAFAYFRHVGVTEVACQRKHMGSRAVVVLCRDAEAARRRFGATTGEIGQCVTRTGRRFFDDPTVHRALLEEFGAALERAGFWEEFGSDWACFDCELMPWNAKAQGLLREQYAPVGAAAEASLTAAVAVLEQAAARGQEVAEHLAHLRQRLDDVSRYRIAYAHYCWDVQGLEGIRIAPFHLLATEGRTYFDRDHLWHMTTLARLTEQSDLLQATDYLLVDTGEAESVAAGTRWWEEMTAAGGEGMVVKPREFIVRGAKGLVQPAVKVRGREYLRIIYGPEYTEPENIERLRKRGLGAKRSLALREFALGVEGLERFVRKEPLRRVHECAFAVLALESEPVDPRL